MILSLICLAALQSTTAADFFPLVPGTVRTYEQKGGNTTLLVSTVGKPLDMGGVDVFPISDSSGKTTYYRVQSDQVTIVAYQLSKPMTTPMPVMRIGTGKVTWDFQGTTGTTATTGLNGERLLEHGEANLHGQRNVLGKKVDVLTVKLTAAVGIGLSGYTVEQTAIYGRGIGLVEMTTKTRLGRGKAVESSCHLVSIEAAK